jgi:cyclopropane fatty-acyl-phospholipid synthase-like methyltransferase
VKDLPFAPACERNKQPILEVLQRVLPETGRVLEIGSGTGQHIVHFAAHLPKLTWQPSDRAENLSGLQRRLDLVAGANVLPAIELDVAGRWPGQMFDAVISANTAHIMSWPEVTCMFDGVANVLQARGVYSLYGPFNMDGQFTAPSNREFDQQLRSRAGHMGLRDVADLEKLGLQHQLLLYERINMPANNMVLVFRKQPITTSPPGQQD